MGAGTTLELGPLVGGHRNNSGTRASLGGRRNTSGTRASLGWDVAVWNTGRVGAGPSLTPVYLVEAQEP